MDLQTGVTGLCCTCGLMDWVSSLTSLSLSLQLYWVSLFPCGLCQDLGFPVIRVLKDQGHVSCDLKGLLPGTWTHQARAMTYRGDNGAMQNGFNIDNSSGKRRRQLDEFSHGIEELSRWCLRLATRWWFESRTMILLQVKLTMWCWAIKDWVTDFFFVGLRFVAFRWMGLKDSLNFGCKFFVNGWVIVDWPQWFYRWDQMSDRYRFFYYSRLTGSDTSNGSEFSLIPNLMWTNQNITTRKIKIDDPGINT